MTDMLGLLDKLRLIDDTIDRRVAGIAYKEYLTPKQKRHWLNIINIERQRREKILVEMGISKPKEKSEGFWG